MDFVERWFGISPDGGSGTFELGAALAILAIILLVFSRCTVSGIFHKRFEDLIGRGDRL